MASYSLCHKHVTNDWKRNSDFFLIIGNRTINVNDFRQMKFDYNDRQLKV